MLKIITLLNWIFKVGVYLNHRKIKLKLVMRINRYEGASDFPCNLEIRARDLYGFLSKIDLLEFKEIVIKIPKYYFFTEVMEFEISRMAKGSPFVSLRHPTRNSNVNPSRLNSEISNIMNLYFDSSKHTKSDLKERDMMNHHLL